MKKNSFIFSGDTIEERKPTRPIMIYVHGESFRYKFFNKRVYGVVASKLSS